MNALRRASRRIALVLVGSIAASGSAMALPSAINGSSFTVSGSLIPLPTGITTDQAAGLDFLNFGAGGTPGGTVSLTGVPSGSFSSWLSAAACPSSPAAGGCGSIVDLSQFLPFTAIPSFLSVTQSGGTVSFDLTTLNSITRTPAGAGTSASIALGGTGMIHASGLADTAGSFSLFTTDSAGVTTFSATTTADSTIGTADVPEPASILLMGFGLLALGTVARARRA